MTETATGGTETITEYTETVTLSQWTETVTLSVATETVTDTATMTDTATNTVESQTVTGQALSASDVLPQDDSLTGAGSAGGGSGGTGSDVFVPFQPDPAGQLLQNTPTVE
jgi:hypothetical protein